MLTAGTFRSQVFVSQLSRWKMHCANCNSPCIIWVPTQPPRATCARPLDMSLGEVILDKEFRANSCQRAYIDVTVRHSVPRDLRRLAMAARTGSTVKAQAEISKRQRDLASSAPERGVHLARRQLDRAVCLCPPSGHARESCRNLSLANHDLVD